jgi:perosamine synthetase
MKAEIFRNVLSSEATLRNVLMTLNEGLYGIVLITNDRNKPLGLFTDGDIRRALLKGASLESLAIDWMNTSFVAGRASNPRETNILLISSRIRDLPIVDEQGYLVDMIRYGDISGVPVMSPSLNGNELKYVADCIRSSWISSQGSYVQSFEEQFARYLNCSYALTTSNGTTALHLAIAALNIGPGDEVIIPNLTFAASANAVLHNGATPVFVDVDPIHWTIDVAAVEAAITPRTKAIMPVHLYGHPCDMGKLSEIASAHKLFIVEDCAESLGARYQGQMTGTLGHIGCFSFFSNKVITTGEGGMVTTNDPDLRERMKVLRDHGMAPNRRYWHEMVGYNYRMTNIQAALGVAQMEQIELFLENRQRMAAMYGAELRGISGVSLPPNEDWADNIYWLYTIMIEPSKFGIDRDGVMRAMAREGIETRPVFYPLNIQPAYAGGNARWCGPMVVSEQLSRKGLSLPSSNALTPQEVRRVCATLRKIANDKRRMQQLGGVVTENP